MITRKTPKEEVLSMGKSCRMCGHCCRFGAGCLAEDDLERLSALLGLKEEEVKEKYLEEVDLFNTKMLRPRILRKNGKPFGPCVFLTEDNKCSIHEAKPLQCRIGSCMKEGSDIMEWFYLNYCVDPFDPASLRQWSERLKVKQTITGGRPEDLVPDEKARQKIMKMEQ